jgi:hypothetical protein
VEQVGKYRQFQTIKLFFSFVDCFSFYFPEPTLGSAKNPDSGADLDLSLVSLHLKKKNKCSLKSFQLIDLTRSFSEE